MTTPSNPYAELIEAVDRLDMHLAEAPTDAEKCFVSLDDHRAIIAGVSQLTRDVEELVEALQELAEAVANDANGEHGISGFLGARLTDARDALAHITLTRLSGEEK